MTLAEAAVLVEQIAVGDEGPNRQRTVDKLQAGTHPDVGRICAEALLVALSGLRETEEAVRMLLQVADEP